MRTLKFIVDGQTIRPDPDCSFEGLVPGTDGYLQAEFTFSHEWDGCVKVVSFYSQLGVEYRPQILKDGKSCIIPSEALAKRVFKIRVTGATRDGLTIVTHKLAIDQKGA